MKKKLLISSFLMLMYSSSIIAAGDLPPGWDDQPADPDTAPTLPINEHLIWLGLIIVFYIFYKLRKSHVLKKSNN